MNDDIVISFDVSCYMGKQRSGKTLSMVARGYEILFFFQNYIYDMKLKKEKGKKLTKFERNRLALFKKYNILSNLNLNKRIFGDYEHFSAKDLLRLYQSKEKIENRIILLDDFFKDIDSRDFGRESNKVFSYFITEIGKKKNILLYVSHFDSMVEKRLRQHTENFILCRKGKMYDIRLPNGKLLKNVWREDENYYTLDTEKESKKIIIQQNYFKDYIDFDHQGFIFDKNLQRIDYLEAYHYFNMYDTGEIV